MQRLVWRFKRGDFDLSNKDRRKPPKKFKDAELQALLDKDSTQTLKQLAKALGVDQGTISRRLHAIEKIQKEGKCVPYELKERDIERRKTTCKILFDRFKRKSFLHRIVTGDEKWIDFHNHKRKKSHWDKFLGTVTKNLVVKIVFNNIFRVEISWSFL